jgi:hypothetical protein
MASTSGSVPSTSIRLVPTLPVTPVMTTLIATDTCGVPSHHSRPFPRCRQGSPVDTDLRGRYGKVDGMIHRGAFGNGDDGLIADDDVRYGDDVPAPR